MKTKTSIISLIVSIYIGIVATIGYAANTNEVEYNRPVFVQKSLLIINTEPVVIQKVMDSRVPKDKSKRCPQWESKFKEYGLPVDVFSYIAWRESGCNPEAINAKFNSNGKVIWTLNKNGSIDRGLVQINSCWRSVTKKVCGTNLNGLLGVDCNLKVAKYIMDNSEGKLLNWNIQN
jgi:hypothetical protein